MLLQASGARRALTGCLLAGALAASPTGAAGAIMNGDFSAGLTSWAVDIGDVSVPAAADPFALLTDASGSATLFQVFPGPAGSGDLLSFDFVFATASTSGTSTDSFGVGLLSDDLADPFVGIVTVDEAFMVVPDPGVGFTPAAVIPDYSAPGGATAFSGTITLTLPDILIGDSLTLFFDLFDNDPASASTEVAIDNVTHTPVVMPEPHPLALILAALLLMGAAWPGGRRSRV